MLCPVYYELLWLYNSSRNGGLREEIEGVDWEVEEINIEFE